MGPVVDGGVRGGGAVLYLSYQRRKCDDGRVQGGGPIWRYGDVDGRPGESLHFNLNPEDGRAKDDGGDFRSMHMRRYL